MGTLPTRPTETHTTQPTLTKLTTWTSFPFPDLVTWWLPTHCHCTVYTNNIYRGFMSLLQLVDLTWQYQHPTVWVSRRSCSCHSCVGSRGFKWFSYHKPAFLWQLPSTWYLEVKLAITLEFDIVCLKKHHKYGLISAFNGKTVKHEKHISIFQCGCCKLQILHCFLQRNNFIVSFWYTFKNIMQHQLHDPLH